MDQDADTHYSRDDVVREVTALYEFLTTMYLPNDAIRRPPPDGWSNITQKRLAFLEKDDTVIDLLRHLPYLKLDGAASGFRHRGYEILDECMANDYAGGQFQEDRTNKWGKVLTSDISRQSKQFVEPNDQAIPSYVATIASPSTKYGWWVWLDTRNGKVNMLLCVFGAKRGFRNIGEFCEFVKSRFQTLQLVPQSERTVKEDKTEDRPPCRASEIFTSHGWPSLEYDKKGCMAELEKDEDVQG